MEDIPKNPDGFETEIKELEENVRSAENFDELFDIIRGAGVIEGSLQTITADQMIGAIEHTRDAIRSMTSVPEGEHTGTFPVLGIITRAHGFRHKVAELLLMERNAKIKELLS